MVKVIDFLKRNKSLVGLVLTAVFAFLQAHPEYDSYREILGWIAGALCGAGVLESDKLASMKQGKTPVTAEIKAIVQESEED